MSNLTLNGKVTVSLPSDKTPYVSNITNEENLTLKFGDITATDKSTDHTLDWAKVSDGNFTYTSAGVNAGWYIDDNKLSYRKDNRQRFTLNGMNPHATVDQVKAAVSISDKLVTFTDDTLLGDSVTITGDDFLLGLGNLSESTAQAASLQASTYTSAGYTAGRYMLDGALTLRDNNVLHLNQRDAAKLNVNVLVSDAESTVFHFKAAALKKENVAISGDNAFTVELDADVDATADSLAGGTLNYKAAYTGEYYSATASGVSYTAQGAGEQFTLSGIISGKQVTVNQSALDMTATAAYTVKLAGDYTLNFLANTDGTEVGACLGTYTSAYTPAYFTDLGSEYTYTPAEEPSRCTISGLGTGACAGGERHNQRRRSQSFERRIFLDAR